VSMPSQQDFSRCAAIATALFLAGTFALAQETDERQGDDDQVIEEIIVYGGQKRGDPVDVEALYEEMMRERLMLEQEQLRVLREESEWRSANAVTVEEPSRIQWGYDAEEELRMRRESDLDNVEFVTTRPATLFRVGF